MMREHGRRSAIVIVFISAYFVSYFYRSSNAVIADDLARDIGLDAGALGLMTSVFFFAFAAMQLPIGSALDRFGARWVTSSLLLVAAVGSLVFAASATFMGLTVGRALIGVGMAGVLMGALKAFAVWFEPRAFASAAGLIVGMGSLGAVAATTPLALLNEAFGWQPVFVGAGVVTVVVAVAVALVVRDPMTTRPAPSIRAGSGVFTDVFRSGPFWRVAGLAFAKGGTLMAFQGLWAGPFLTQVLGVSAIASGNVLFVMGLAATIGFLLAGPLAGRFGLGRSAGVGAVLLATSLVALLCVGSSWPLWAVACVFALLAFAASTNVLSFALARNLFPSMPGRAVTAVNLFGMGGAAFMQWGLGSVIQLFEPTAEGFAPPVAFATAISMTLAIVLAALAAYAPMMRAESSPS